MEKHIDRYGYENAIESQFNKFDISAKLAVGKELLPKLQMFWEIQRIQFLFSLFKNTLPMSVY